MTITKAIRDQIEAMPAGKAFTAKELLCLGTRAAVDQALYRMAKDGEILRIARGIYARPKWTPYVKAPVLPGPYQIAELAAKTKGVRIGPTGAEAVNILGLSTQVPVQPVYATTGRSGTLTAGNYAIHLRHVTPQKMQYAGTVVGIAIAALRYLGKNQVTPEVIATLERKLNPEDFQRLRRATTALPGWAMDKFYEYEASRHD